MSISAPRDKERNTHNSQHVQRGTVLTSCWTVCQFKILLCSNCRVEIWSTWIKMYVSARAVARLRQWHILQTFHSFTFLFLSPSHCEAHSSSTTRRVTHHAEANMPIVCATSRVCKFHTCPIILNPSPPLPSLPFPSPPPFVPSLFSHMLLSPSLTHTSHWTAWGVGSSAALLRTCNREQGHPAGSDGNAEGLCLSHRPPLLVYKQVSLDLNPFFFF